MTRLNAAYFDESVMPSIRSYGFFLRYNMFANIIHRRQDSSDHQGITNHSFYPLLLQSPFLDAFFIPGLVDVEEEAPSVLGIQWPVRNSLNVH